jgi:nucleotide-binding universal stress UspA family protein
MYNVIVVGADDSPTALEAVRQAIGFAKMSGGTLHFVTAYKPKPVDTSDVPDEFRYSMASTHEADVLLRRLTDLARAEGVDSEVHAVTSDPADALITVAWGACRTRSPTAPPARSSSSPPPEHRRARRDVRSLG